MFRNFMFCIAFCVAVLGTASAAFAAPTVVLKLSGAVVAKAADGTEKATPLSDAAVKPGDTIRWEIVAINKGDQPARNFLPADKIPNGTAYNPGSAVPGAASVVFSIDGGKTWSAKPMVTVHTPSGDVVKPADPALYTDLRWIVGKTIAPSETVTYTYEVHVK